MLGRPGTVPRVWLCDVRARPPPPPPPPPPFPATPPGSARFAAAAPHHLPAGRRRPTAPARQQVVSKSTRVGGCTNRRLVSLSAPRMARRSSAARQPLPRRAGGPSGAFPCAPPQQNQPSNHPACAPGRRPTVTAPSQGSSVTVRPGASGVPRWSVLPCQNTRLRSTAHGTPGGVRTWAHPGTAGVALRAPGPATSFRTAVSRSARWQGPCQRPPRCQHPPVVFDVAGPHHLAVLEAWVRYQGAKTKNVFHRGVDCVNAAAVGGRVRERV